MWYASNVVTFIADPFASFYVIKNRKEVKIVLNVLCWSVEFVVIVWLGWTIAEAEGEVWVW